VPEAWKINENTADTTPPPPDAERGRANTDPDADDGQPSTDQDESSS
jgi:hypothetical protein